MRIVRFALPALLVLGFALPNASASAQESEPQQAQEAGEQAAAESQEAPPRFEAVVIVTASRTEELRLESSTSVSVVPSWEITASPATNYADLLRRVPGLNVSQTSARDINMTTRAATKAAATGTLAMIDGRPLNQDFFGFVMWDLLPIELGEIEQIEVVRGPGSAVWGPNAMNGVVNVRTASPRSLGDATRVQLAGGGQSTFQASALHSGVNGPWAYKASASYLTQDAWPRPETLPSGLPGNLYANEGTQQPKFDGRVDRNAGDGMLSFGGGFAGTSGLFIGDGGPWGIDPSTFAWHLRGDYDRDRLNVRAYANFLDGEATNLLEGTPFRFDTRVYDLSVQNDAQLGSTRLVYGGNVRLQRFFLSIAPGEDTRWEGGAFAEARVPLGDHFRLQGGARIDAFSSLDGPVLSPRAGLSYHFGARRQHVLRASFNRAYRAPSLLDNYTDLVLNSVIDLGAITGIPGLPIYSFPFRSIGNLDLQEERLDQIEIGYGGRFGDLGVELAVYRSVTKDLLDFYPSVFYSPTDPPPGWPLPPGLLALLPLPKEFTFRNVGEVRNRGFEVGLRGYLSPAAELYANYTWMAEPRPEGISLDDINVPPEHRLTLGLTGFLHPWFYGASVHYVGEAIWNDVLDARFHGATPAFTTLDAMVGYRLPNELGELTLRGTNLTDEPFQQHVFGDVIGRRILVGFSHTFR